MSSKRWVVTDREHGMSLVAFLKQVCPDAISTKALKRLIEEKKCLVNGRVTFFSSHKLMKGDAVELSFSLPEKSSESGSFIVYEDDDLLIVNKPSGVVSDMAEISRFIPTAEPLHLIHRLDKDTSGLIMLARSEPFFLKMKDLFSQKKVQKFYLALVDGKMPKKEGLIDNYLAVKGEYSGQKIYGSGTENKGQRAITVFRALQHGDSSSLVLLQPKTGRTHQLRVHMKELGYPILGDFQYGKTFTCPVLPRRHMLHAFALFFVHPRTGKEQFFTAPVPQDFEELAKQLRVSLSDVDDLTSLPAIIKLLQR